MEALTRPDGPKGLPFIGPAREVKRGGLDFVRRMARDYGDLAYARFAGLDAYLVSHPDLVEEVMVRKRKIYGRSDLNARLKPLLGEGLLTAEGDGWLAQRRLMAPAFHHQRIAGYAETMVAATVDGLADWQPGQVRSVDQDFNTMTLDIAIRTLFGVDVGDAGRRVGEAFVEVSAYFEKTLTQAVTLPLWVPTPRIRAFVRARDELDEVVARIIADRRAMDTDGNDLLSMLLSLRDEDGVGMDDKQLRDEVLTLLLAGHETTSLTLTYTTWLLARNPEAERKLAQELHDVLGDRDPTMTDLRNLPYLDKVVKESMRLYPPASIIGRQARVDDTLGGFEIPAGSLLVLPVFVVHRDRRWWDVPDSFWPERWTPEMEKALPKFAYFPFGGGPRVCVGRAFAAMEARLVLATLLRRFRLAPVDNDPLDLVATVTTRPKDAVRLEIRSR
jgi:cytochrome P450